MVHPIDAELDDIISTELEFEDPSSYTRIFKGTLLDLFLLRHHRSSTTTMPPPCQHLHPVSDRPGRIWVLLFSIRAASQIIASAMKRCLALGPTMEHVAPWCRTPDPLSAISCRHMPASKLFIKPDQGLDDSGAATIDPAEAVLDH